MAGTPHPTSLARLRQARRSLPITRLWPERQDCTLATHWDASVSAWLDRIRTSTPRTTSHLDPDCAKIDPRARKRTGDGRDVLSAWGKHHGAVPCNTCTPRVSDDTAAAIDALDQLQRAHRRRPHHDPRTVAAAVVRFERAASGSGDWTAALRDTSRDLLAWARAALPDEDLPDGRDALAAWLTGAERGRSVLDQPAGGALGVFNANTRLHRAWTAAIRSGATRERAREVTTGMIDQRIATALGQGAEGPRTLLATWEGILDDAIAGIADDDRHVVLWCRPPGRRADYATITCADQLARAASTVIPGYGTAHIVPHALGAAVRSWGEGVILGDAQHLTAQPGQIELAAELAGDDLWFHPPGLAHDQVSLIPREPAWDYIHLAARLQPPGRA